MAKVYNCIMKEQFNMINFTLLFQQNITTEFEKIFKKNRSLLVQNDKICNIRKISVVYQRIREKKKNHSIFFKMLMLSHILNSLSVRYKTDSNTVKVLKICNPQELTNMNLLHKIRRISPCNYRSNLIKNIYFGNRNLTIDDHYHRTININLKSVTGFSVRRKCNNQKFNVHEFYQYLLNSNLNINNSSSSSSNCKKTM